MVRLVLIDEMSNEGLSAPECVLLSVEMVAGERDRVAAVIARNVMTGADLSFWFERQDLLEALLQEKV